MCSTAFLARNGRAVTPDEGKHRIVKMTEARLGAYHAAFDLVARERRCFPQLVRMDGRYFDQLAMALIKADLVTD